MFQSKPIQKKIFGSSYKNENRVISPQHEKPRLGLVGSQVNSLKKALELQLSDPAILPEVARNLKHQITELNELVEEDNFLKVTNFNADFEKWLVGRGRESDHAQTPWYRTPLIDLPGVKEIIEPKITKRFEFMEKLEKLQLYGPTDLNSAKEYYKYIVRGGEDGELNWLRDWSLTENDEIDRVRLGNDIVDKLNNYICKKDPITANWDNLTNDFEDYIRITSETNPGHRNFLRRKFTYKKKILQDIMLIPDRDKITSLFKDYLNYTSDFEDIFKIHVDRRDYLTDQRNLTISRFEELLTFNPDLSENEDIWNYFNSKISDYDSEIKDLVTRTIQFWNDNKNNLTDQQKNDLLNHNVVHIDPHAIPEDVQAYLNGGNLDSLQETFLTRWGTLNSEILSLCRTANDRQVKRSLWLYRGMSDELESLFGTLEPVLSELIRDGGQIF